MDKYRFITFPVHATGNGTLKLYQKDEYLPFEIGKVLAIQGMEPTDVRGKHAHKETCEIVVALQGGCIFEIDDGHEKSSVTLNDPAQALYLPARVWRTFHSFEQGTILLIIADRPYDKEDYIFNYDDFLQIVR